MKGARSYKRPALTSLRFPARTPIFAFDEIAALVGVTRPVARRTVNVQPIDLYWKIGAAIT